MKCAWLTDIHLNFIAAYVDRDAFYRRVRGSGADCVLLGGDVGEAADMIGLLFEMVEAIEKPIYFVLGNHDYYGSGIRMTRAKVRDAVTGHPLLQWLPDMGCVELDKETALIGHGGWADGRFGDFMKFEVLLKDYRSIHDFIAKDRESQLQRLYELGDEAAEYYKPVVQRVIDTRGKE